MLGTRFNPESVATLTAEIQRQRMARRDYIYPASALGFTDDGQVILKSVKAFAVGDRTYTDWALAEAEADRVGERIVPAGEVAPMAINGTAFSQLRGVLGIPAKYTDDLRKAGYGDILGYNFRELLARNERRFLVRTLTTSEGRPYVRAVLSDKYRILDNADLFFAAAETFMETPEGMDPGTRRADLWKARLSDDTFEMFGVSPSITAKVRLDRPFAPGEQWKDRFGGNAHQFTQFGGDVHSAAVHISNSETGRGGLRVDLSIMRSMCVNFAIIGEGVAKIHLGRTAAEEGLILSDETKEAESRVTWLKVRDAIRTAFNPERFQALIDQLNNATQQVLPSPQKAVDNVVEAYGLSDERKAVILAELLGSGDPTRFGLIQAVTAAGRMVESENVEAAEVLESLGGELQTLDDAKYAALVGA